jgi:hypothetical protein
MSLYRKKSGQINPLNALRGIRFWTVDQSAHRKAFHLTFEMRSYQRTYFVQVRCRVQQSSEILFTKNHWHPIMHL